MSTLDPEAYGRTRNYGKGAVTKLSPYLSRGVISTKQVFNALLDLNKPWKQIEKLTQELAWRDYWQQVWISKGDLIDSDLKNTQKPISNWEIPLSIIKASTDIKALDQAIDQMYLTGYMHNHMRMYTASICCNIAQSHWLQPSKWMYANLLDGDLASNQLSWQWVSGVFSNKKYYANQDNINHFFESDQKNTFLDIEYDKFPHLKPPEILKDTVSLEVKYDLSLLKDHCVITDQQTLVYNYYNLDPYWHRDENYQRILIIEPSKFKRNPVGQKCLDFAVDLSKNISGIKIFVGEFESLAQIVSKTKITYKEHPLNYNYIGNKEPREWLSSTKGYFPSFFAFWKQCKKELQQ
ncbi:MAG: FAD-binding domain-containing protein [Flavobacteriaceae bacterium]